VALRLKSEPAPAELYKESDLVIRTIRDVYDSSLSKIVVDSPVVAARVRDFLSIASPRSQDVVEEYSGAEPMFHRYGIESEIDKLHSRQVSLPCGGSLVIEQTEALVAIDVNSGRFRIPENAEETAYRVDLEAVDEIARQLRLRDLGGLIICDLIDMGQEKHRRAVERRLAEALKKHKERAKLLRISKFGILEMTRQRQRPSFAKSIYRDCPRCSGSGRVKTPESASLDVMRQIRLASNRAGVASVDVGVSPMVANDLLNRKRHQLTDLERATGQTIRIHAKDELNMDDVRVSCTDRRGREVPASATELDGGGRTPPPTRVADKVIPKPEISRPVIAPPQRPSGNNQGRPSGRRRGGRRRGRHGGGAGGGGPGSAGGADGGSA
jgi:ribonuclease E